MNPEIASLLSKLAEKLGTTTEYLWGVLLKQAPISAMVELFQILLTIVAVFVLYRIHKKNVVIEDCYVDNPAKAVVMVVMAVALGIVVIIEFCCLENVVNGFFNPEYWALHRILSEIH